jgi:hypothetical protein
MRKNKLIYLFASYVAQHGTMIETIQPDFTNWLGKNDYENLLELELPIFRLFQSLCKDGFLEKTDRKLDGKYSIYHINRVEFLDADCLKSDSDMLMRVLFSSMLEELDYNRMPHNERNLLRQSLIEPRGALDGSRIRKMSEIIRWNEHPILALSGENLMHFELLTDAVNQRDGLGKASTSLLNVIGRNSLGNEYDIALFPIEVQVRRNNLLLFALSADKSNVLWIPFNQINAIHQNPNGGFLHISSSTHTDASMCSKFIHPEVLTEYRIQNLLNHELVVLQFDAQGWERLHNGNIPIEADLDYDTLTIEFYSPFNPSFYRWILQFVGHVKILEPSSLFELVQQELNTMFAKAV